MILKVPLTLSRGLVSKLETIGGKVLAHLSGSQKGSALWPTLAAFQILLSRYSRQDDITIGVPSTHSGKEVCFTATISGSMHYWFESQM